MTTKKKKSRSKSDAESAAKPKTGIDYLSRTVNGVQRMDLETKAAFAKGMEKGFRVGRRLQLMFDLHDAVARLRAAKVPIPGHAMEFEQTDPVLHLLDEAGEVAKEFIQACAPLVDLLPQIEPAFEKLDAFLKANRIFKNKRRSLTDRLLVGLAVARIEEIRGGKVRLEPKEMVEFCEDLDVFDGDGPEADDWKEILWKMRPRLDAAGKRVPHKERGRLLEALELALQNRMKKTEGQ